MRRIITMMLMVLSVWTVGMSIEEPSYTVVIRSGQFEIRQYDPYIVVETMIQGTEMDEASNAGFRKLFKYISGNNRSNSEIGMTAPVITERSEKIEMTAPVTTVRTPEGYAIAFIVPKQYNAQTVPVPNDSTVHIREVPGRTVAVIRFSGRWTDDNMKEHELELMQWLKETGKVPVSAPVIARYDPPFMPWFMRRNEIHVGIEPS